MISAFMENPPTPTLDQEHLEKRVLKISPGWVLSGLLVGLVAAFLYFPPALVNEAPFHDDKAYINNALIASGRIAPEMAIGPYAEERPPLFWWLITGLFLLGAPNESVRWISPLTATLGVVGVYLLASRLFNDFRVGLLSGAFISVSDFYVLTTSYSLTDSIGSILAVLAILSFSLGLRDGVFMWLAGPLTAISIIARDQNLLIIPVIIISLVLVSRLGLKRKVLLLAAIALALSPAIALTQDRMLQIVSDIITPILKDPAYIYILASFLALSTMIVYKVAEQKNLISGRTNVGERIFDIGLAAGLALLLLHPFFIDNIRLGDTFQIAGKGILSRPVAHSIMARELGVGAELSYMERVVIWTSETIKLATIPLLALSALGAVLILWGRARIGRPVVLWGFLSLGYVILFTHLEYRFLAQAIPPLAILAAYAITRLWKTSRIFPAILIPLTLFFLFLPPQPNLPIPDITQPTGIQGLNTLLSGSPSGGWLTDYLAYLKTVTPTNRIAINPLNPITGLTVIPLLIATLYIGVRRITIPEEKPDFGKAY
ncbi:MAG: hypothetical protein QXK39_02305 [Nitrososphaerota archaeon]